MSVTIVLPEKVTLRALAQKLLIEKVGFYIKPLTEYYDSEGDIVVVPCRAIIPNYITNKSENTKIFTYYFDDVADIKYKKVNDEYKLLDYPSQKSVELDIANRFINLTKEIESKLLTLGANSWGSLPLLKQFLSPLYAMVAHLFEEGHIPFSQVISKKNQKYTQLLLKSNYMTISEDYDNLFIKTNKFEMFKEQMFDTYGESYEIRIIDNIVGDIFAENYEIIKKNIPAPSSYVDTIKFYYFDALRFGENIRVTEKDFEKNFIFYTASYSTSKSFNLKRTLFELSATGLLNKEDEFYFGSEYVYDNLVSYRDSLLRGAKDMLEVF